MPDPANLPKGCKFYPRCPRKLDICEEKEPELKELGDGHSCRCYLPQKEGGKADG